MTGATRFPADRLPDPSLVPTPRRRWGFWEWAALVVAAGVHLTVMAVVAAMVAFGSQGSCGNPASTFGLHQARVGLAVVVAMSAGPWLVAALTCLFLDRPWFRYVVAATAVALTPVLFLGSAQAATPAEWTSSMCFF